MNTYGQTKYDGEMASLENNNQSYIFRLPILYGPLTGVQQIIEKMILKMINGEKIWANDNVFTSPTFVDDISTAILEITATQKPGVYHLTNEGAYSLKEFLELFNNHFGLKYQFITEKPVGLVEREPKLAVSYLKSHKIAPLRKIEDCMKDYVTIVRNYIKDQS